MIILILTDIDFDNINDSDQNDDFYGDHIDERDEKWIMDKLNQGLNKDEQYNVN